MRAAFILVLLAGCAPPGGERCGVDLHCGSDTIDVPHDDGSVDRVQVYAARPIEGTALDVVVYAHGQGLGGVSNCAPDASTYSTPQARALAAEGFAAVAVHYRNSGEDVPGLGVLRARDHHLQDARAVLAAAHHVIELLGEDASGRVGLVGSSMGTWPSLWAVGADPRLTELQSGLDLRTVVVHGETGNHLANGSRRCEDATSDHPEALTRYIMASVYAVLRSHTVLLGMSEVRREDLAAGQPLGDALRASLTEQGVDALAAIFFEPPDPAIEGCASLVDRPAECGESCAFNTFRARFGELPPPEDFVRPHVLETFCAFGPDTPDPGPDTGNPLTGALRELSPAYTLEGPTRVDRALSLLSEGDGHYNPTAQALLRERMAALGVEMPEPAPNPGPDCGHGDYEDRSRRDCGIDLIVAELTEAFAE